MTTREQTLKALMDRNRRQLSEATIGDLAEDYSMAFGESAPDDYPRERMELALSNNYHDIILALPTSTLLEYLSPGTFDESNLEQDR